MLPSIAQTIPRSEVDVLRCEIDRIDDALLRLVELRMHRCERIGVEKRRALPSDPSIRPSREREVVDRLSERTQNLPASAVAAIWRELMAVSVQGQRRSSLAVHAPCQPVAVTDCARRSFGCSAPLVEADSPEEALDCARSDGGIAVIELAPAEGWWAQLVKEPELIIFRSLRDLQGRIVAMAVGRIPGEPISYPILSDAEVRRRRADGIRVRPIAMWRELRLCEAQANEPGVSR